MTAPKLNRFVPLEEFQLTGPVDPVTELWLPTERVVLEPGIVTPRCARVYSTEWLVVDSTVMTWRQAQQTIPGYTGSGGYPAVNCWEVWIDTGMDGHTDYRLVGYVWLSSEDQRVPDDQRYPTYQMQSWYWDHRAVTTREEAP